MNTNILKIIFPLAISIILFACNENKPKKDLIPEAEMVGLLINMHQIEARLEQYPATKDTLGFIMHYSYQKLFEEFNIPKEKFDKSLNYYQDNPALLDEIYEKVVDSLSTLDAEIKAWPQDESEIDTLNTTIDSLPVK